MNTPAPDSTGRFTGAGRQANGQEINGSTPRVVVTRGSTLPRGDLEFTATRLFRDPWRPMRMLRLQLSEFKNMKLWRGAILEAIFTGMWVFASILLVSASANWGKNLLGRTILVTTSLHAVLFFIYIQSAVILSANECGSPKLPNLNPAITLLQMLNGVQGLVGGLLFVIFQCAGAILAALAAKELLPQDRIDHYLLAGCYGRRTILLPTGLKMDVGLSDHKYFLAEFAFSFLFLYLTALLTSQRQLRELGIKITVLLVSINIGFNLYISSSIRLGYSGSMFNPARCLGSAVAYGQPLWDRLWPPFVAPFVSSFTVALIFATVPPEHAELYVEKKDVISKIRRHWSNRATGRGADFQAGSSQLDDRELQSNTVYEVPSAGRLFSASPETPDLHPPPEPAQAV